MKKQQYNLDDIYSRIESAWKNAGFKNAAQFSAESHINVGTISSWKPSKKKPEQKPSIPSVKQLVQICNTCECDIDYLLGRIPTFKRDNESIQDATGLDEKAIDVLREYQRTDRVRIDTYNKKLDAYYKKSSVLSEEEATDFVFNERKPISMIDIISTLIANDRFSSVCITLEKMASELPKDARGRFVNSTELYDYKTYRLTKDIESILRKCVDELIEK